MSKVNCAVYIRKSTEKGLEQEFNSLHNQEEACKAYILSQAFNNWEYFKTYEDGEVSGGTMKRPGLQQMLIDMQKGKIQTVLVYKVDRLSRSILDFHNMMKQFEKYDCNFVSITQSFDTSNSMGKLTLNMLLSFAQFEREVSAERVRDKIAASKAKGLWTGGNLPLGYDLVDRKLVINEKESKVVRQIFEKYLELDSIREVVDRLNKEGYKTKVSGSRGGGDFTKSIVGKLLKNKIYVGLITDKKRGKEYKGQHEALIDKEIFEEVQEKITRRFDEKTKRKEYTKNSYLLHKNFYTDKGVLFKFTNSKKHNRRFNYYFTKGYYLPAEQIDEVIINSLNFIGLSKSEMKKLISKVIYSLNNNLSKLEIHLKLDSKLGSFKKPKEAEFSLDNKTLILKAKFMISNQTSSKIKGNSNKKVLSINEMNEQITRGVSYGWYYKKLWEQGATFKSIAEKEKIAERTVQKYFALTLLSPRIIEDIFEHKNPSNFTLTQLIELAQAKSGFEEQEGLWG